MRSMLHALTWDYFRYAGGGLLTLWAISFAPLLVIGSLKSMGIQRGDPAMLLLELSLLPLIILILMGGAAIGLRTVRNLATKPISNLAIASWRIGSGALVLAMQLGTVIWFCNAMFDAGWPLRGAVLFAVAAWVTGQPFLCLGGRSLSKMALTGLPIFLMCCWYMARYKSLRSHGITYDWNEVTASEALQLIGVIVVFSVLTVRCVALDRCGDSQIPTRLHVWMRRTITAWWNSRIAVRKPYRSPQQAQFWFEWKSKGWLLPMVLAVLMVVWLVGSWIEGNSLNDMQVGLVTVLFLLSIASVGVGGVIGHNLHSIQITADSGRNGQTQSGSVSAIGSFLATRPLSDADMARTFLKICASNSLLSVGVWLLFAAPVLVYGWSIGQPLELKAELHWLAPLLSFLITWAVASNVMVGASTGRLRVLAQLLVVVLLSYTMVEITLRSLGMLRWVELVEWLALLAVTVGTIALTAWCYHRAYQHGDIRLSHTAMAAIVAIIIVVSGMLCLPKVTALEAICFVCLAALSVLPWASAPLAIRWNRHR